MSYWTVAQTQNRREQLARILLERDGYEIYAPQVKLVRGQAVLLFPSYLFVRIMDRWYPVLSMPGVARVLMAGEQPARVPDEVMAGLRGREDRNGFVKLPPKHPRRGQRMRIVGGMFGGHLAVFEGMSGRERVRVLLELLGQTVTVELPARDAVAV